MDLFWISRRGAQDRFDASHVIPQCWEPGSEDPRSNVPLCPLRRRSLPRQRCRGRRGGVQEITSETLEKSWNHLQNIHHTFANHQILSDWNNEGGNDSQEVDGLLQGDFDRCRQLRHRLQPEYQPLHKGSSTSCHLQHRFCNFHHFHYCHHSHIHQCQLYYQPQFRITIYPKGSRLRGDLPHRHVSWQYFIFLTNQQSLLIQDVLWDEQLVRITHGASNEKFYKVTKRKFSIYCHLNPNLWRTFPNWYS